MRLRVLFVEDSENDKALVLRELKRLGYEAASERVETEEAMQTALRDREWDVIMCDYSLPAFDAPRALNILRASGKDLPFIIVSGTIGEETAVAALKAGAHDFLLKTNLTRLGPVIERELGEAAIRREHRLGQESLAQSEAQLRALFASMQDVVFVLDRGGVYRQIAPTRPGLLYAPPEQLLGKSLREVLPQEQAEEFSRTIERVLESKATIRFEYPLRIDKQPRWFDASISPMTEDTTLWVVRDITERKKAEKVLAETEGRLRAVLASAPITIFVIDRQGVFTLSQGKGMEQTGIKPGEHEGVSAMDLYGTISFVTYTGETMTGREVFERALAGETVNAVDELRGVVFDNHIGPILGPDGEVVGVVGIAVDITERRKAEEALRKSERVLREAEALGHTGSWEQDLITGEIFNTPENLHLFFGGDAGLGGPFEDYSQAVHPDDREYVLRRRGELLEGGPGDIEYRVVWPDGSVHWIFALATIIRDESGKAIRVYGTNLDITDRKQAEEAIQQNLAELKVLYESGLTLGQSLSPKEIAQKLIDLMGAKLDWHHTTIRLHHPENESLELLAFNLPDTMSEAELRATEERFKSLIVRVGDGLSGWAVQHGQTVRVGDLSRDPRYTETVPGLHSGLYIPLQTGDQIVGVISVESEKFNAFTEADERLTATLANQAAVALENARLHEETLHQLRQLQSLHAIDQTIAGSLDQRFTLNVLLNHTLSQLAVDAAAVLLLQPQQNTLQYFIGAGFRTPTIEAVSLKLANTFAGQAVLKRQMIQVRDPQGMGSQPILSKLWSEEGFTSLHAIPLIAKGEVKGVLGVFHRKAFTPDATWIGFLETLAGQAAIAIDNSQMFNDLQRANMELAVAYDATIEGWSQAMDLRDKETEGHTQRVTEMSLQLGRAMKLSDEEITHMRRGALLHDIGKLGVPDHILLKPEKLTREEMDIMKRHPQFAYDMLRPITYLSHSLDIPYCHHEKWDGTGYPRGLKAEQIPLAARIFAVVDVWDALTSDRPYRKAWSKSDALHYIREQSGVHFDPKVVAAFLEEFESGYP